jgi:hypothetical protein
MKSYNLKCQNCSDPVSWNCQSCENNYCDDCFIEEKDKCVDCLEVEQMEKDDNANYLANCI